MTPEETLFIAQQNSPATQDTYERGIRLLSGFTRKLYADITDADLVAWKGYMARIGWKPATQRIYWTAARSFYHWLVGSGRIARSPFDAVKPPERVKNRKPRVPKGDIRTLLDATDDSWRGKRDRAILHLLANGLRIGEVVGLRSDSLTFEAEYEAVVLRVVGKGQKERLVPLGEHTITALQPWLEVSGKDSVWLFANLDLTQMTTRQVREVVERAKKASGRTGLSAHSLRHHYATRLVRAGADVFSVQKLMGHESLSTTQIYVGLDLADTVKAASLDPLK